MGGDTSPLDGNKSGRSKLNGPSSGLKRPTTAAIAASRFGMAKNSVSANQNEKSPAPRTNGTTKPNATPVRSRIGIGGPAIKSAEKDEVDDIYKEKDPIGVSIESRKKAG